MAKIQASKEVADQVLEAIEVASTTGKIRKGTNEVTKALERNEAKLVAIAGDVNPKEIVMHIPIFADEKKIPCYEIASREELGAAAGLQVPTTCVAIIVEGDAKKILQALKA